jgi:integrase
MPVVLTRNEVRAMLDRMSGLHRLVALLLYGAGLRLLDALRLRVKDVDFEMNQITVRDGKGQMDRVTMLPTAAKSLLAKHLNEVRHLHHSDLKLGLGRVYLPFALAEKYPNADREWSWQYVFPRRPTFDRPPQRHQAPPPLGRIGNPARRPRRRPPGRHPQAGDSPFAASFLRPTCWPMATTFGIAEKGIGIVEKGISPIAGQSSPPSSS